MHGIPVTLGVWVAGFGIGVYVASIYSTATLSRISHQTDPSDAVNNPMMLAKSVTEEKYKNENAIIRGDSMSSSNRDRLIIVCTMSYEHIFRRPNLARTAAQLLQAGRVLWIVIEDTHSLRKMASTDDHYSWILEDTKKFIDTLGIDSVYIAEDSPFPRSSPRSPKIETHQRNLGLKYAYSIVENRSVARLHKVDDACVLSGPAGNYLRQAFRSGKVEVSEDEANDLFQCPVVYLADDDNVYMPALWPTLRRIMRVALFSTGNMGYDGIEGPLVARAPDDPERSLRARLTGFNVWHGSDPSNPRGWDKTGKARRFPGDMAGLAFSAVMQPLFSGPRYGFHETDIIEQTGAQSVAQIEGTQTVLAHHVHNEKTSGRLCYPLDWDYESTSSVWFNVPKGKTYSSRTEACGGCAPAAKQTDFRGCTGFKRPRR